MRHNVTNLGSDGGGLRRPAAGLPTELDDVFPVGETHTCDGDDSTELTDISTTHKYSGGIGTTNRRLL